MTPDPTDFPSHHCGCGGHDHAKQKATEPDAGCGCHPEPSTNPPAPAQESHSCGGGCRGIRPYRRMHAFLGVLLIAFLFMHLGVASLGWVPARYDAAASWLRHLSDRVPLLEIGLLLVIVVQILVGIRLLIRSGLRYKSARCKDDGELRYFLQRWSALLLLLFLILHVASFKFWPTQPSFAAASARFTLGGNPLLIAFYVLVMAALAFHAGNGIWTGGALQGVRGRHPRLWLGLACTAGIVVALLGFIALWAFARISIPT